MKKKMFVNKSPRTKRLLYQIFGKPCLFYPRENRKGQGKPCTKSEKKRKGILLSYLFIYIFNVYKEYVILYRMCNGYNNI